MTRLASAALLLLVSACGGFTIVHKDPVASRSEGSPNGDYLVTNVYFNDSALNSKSFRGSWLSSRGLKKLFLYATFTNPTTNTSARVPLALIDLGDEPTYLRSSAIGLLSQVPTASNPYTVVFSSVTVEGKAFDDLKAAFVLVDEVLKAIPAAQAVAAWMPLADKAVDRMSAMAGKPFNAGMQVLISATGQITSEAYVLVPTDRKGIIADERQLEIQTLRATAKVCQDGAREPTLCVDGKPFTSLPFVVVETKRVPKATNPALLSVVLAGAAGSDCSVLSEERVSDSLRFLATKGVLTSTQETDERMLVARAQLLLALKEAVSKRAWVEATDKYDSLLRLPASRLAEAETIDACVSGVAHPALQGVAAVDRLLAVDSSSLDLAKISDDDAGKRLKEAREALGVARAPTLEHLNKTSVYGRVLATVESLETILVDRVVTPVAQKLASIQKPNSPEAQELQSTIAKLYFCERCVASASEALDRYTKRLDSKAAQRVGERTELLSRASAALRRALDKPGPGIDPKLLESLQAGVAEDAALKVLRSRLAGET